MYVLDTSTLIYFFKGLGRVAERLLNVPPSEVAVPTITVFELEVGIAKSAMPKKRRIQLDDFLTAVSVLPRGLREAKTAALIRADLEQAGTPIGPFDILIAGTVLAHQATLVTHNLKQFSKVTNLSTVDWY